MSATYAQEITVEELKSKGAAVLGASEAKSVLTGALVRYETGNNEVQLRLKADGGIDGSGKRRFGGGSGWVYMGSWQVTEEGRWCGETQTFGPAGGNNKFCRDIIKLGDKYYYAAAPAGNAKDDARRASELSISK